MPTARKQWLKWQQQEQQGFATCHRMLSDDYMIASLAIWVDREDKSVQLVPEEFKELPVLN
jgi:hypothetical protein